MTMRLKNASVQPVHAVTSALHDTKKRASCGK